MTPKSPFIGQEYSYRLREFERSEDAESWRGESTFPSRNGGHLMTSKFSMNNTIY